MKTEYLIVLGLTAIVPLIMSFSRELMFYKNVKILFRAIAIPLPVYVLWDVAATALGHWNFNGIYVVGIYIINIPIEEILFFIIIPFVSIFTWESIKFYLKDN